MIELNSCNICCKKSNNNFIKCSICKNSYHFKCLRFKNFEKNYFVKDSIYWYCNSCKYNWPFANLNDDAFIVANSNINDIDNIVILKNQCKNLSFNYSSYSDYSILSHENDIDPDNNFFNNIRNNCKYYDINTNFKTDVNKSLSIIHINARNLNTNFEPLTNFLESTFHKFDVIAVSETGVKDVSTNQYKLEGYRVNHICRKTTKYGGVSLYVKNELNFNIVENMCYCIDDVYECIPIELCNSNEKNTIISCVYRKSGSNINKFNNHFNEFITNVKCTKKPVYICGDFNIDLLKSEKNVGTKNFIELLYSNSFLPLINLPSRITKDTTTMIDNIFTNDITSINKTHCGLYINDVSDHLPVFCITDKNIEKNCKTTCINSRVINDESIEAIKEDLYKEKWSNVFNSTKKIILLTQ